MIKEWCMVKDHREYLRQMAQTLPQKRKRLLKCRATGYSLLEMVPDELDLVQ